MDKVASATTSASEGVAPPPNGQANASIAVRTHARHFVSVLELAEMYAHLPGNPCTGPWDELSRAQFETALGVFSQHGHAQVDSYFFCMSLPAGVVYTSDDAIHLSYPPDAWAPSWIAELLMQSQMLYVEIRHAPLWSDRRTCLKAMFDVMVQLLRMMGNEDFRTKRLAREAQLRATFGADQVSTSKPGHDCDFEIGTTSEEPHPEWHQAPWTSREKAYREQLARALQIIEQSALKYAQFIYFVGMMVALPILVAIVWFIAAQIGGMGFEGVNSSTINLWIVSAAAGATGAIVSVMQRVSADACPLRWRAGFVLLLLMGGFRPIVGAVIAVVAVLTFQAHLVPTLVGISESNLYFASVVAFVAGFSERFARDMLAAPPAQLSITPAPNAKEAAAG